MFIFLVISICLVIGTSLILFARRNFGTLEALGIPVVSPHHYILGSTFSSHSVVNGLRDVAWMKEFGPIYGVYEGQEPQIHICEPELIKRILVKDYQHFNRRREQDFGSPLLNEQLDFLPAEKWKIVRQFLTPHLSSGKIKQMSTAMNECMLDYVNALSSKVGKAPFGKLEDYNLKQETFNLVSDMILRCVFSIKMNRDAKNNQFLKIMSKLLKIGSSGSPDESEEVGISSSIAFSFPFIRKFITKPLFDKHAATEFVTLFKGMLKSRAAAGIQYGDFTDHIAGILEKIQAPEYKQHGISEVTIMCQVLVFFFAAQDPITSTFGILMYYLVNNDAIREKVVQEIDSIFCAKSDKVLDHESLSQLKYLTACINEALRLFPFFIRIERVCTQDWEFDDVEGITGHKFVIKKGSVVIIPTWPANRNPMYFVDPEKFIPERFLAEDSHYKSPTQSAYSFNSFGHGPRNCIGQRFSMEALLFMAAHMLRNFEFAFVNPHSDMEFEAGSLVFGVVKPIFLNVTKRNL